MIKRLNEIRISIKHSVEGEIQKDNIIKSNKIKQFFVNKENMIETKEAKFNMIKSFQGKFDLHSQKSEPNENKRKTSLHNTPRISIVENSPSNISDKIMSIPISHTPNLREFKPNDKYDKKPEAKIKKFDSKEKRRNSIKKNNLDILKKRRGTVKVNDSINIQKLLNSDINIEGNKTEVNNIVYNDNISKIIIGGDNNNFIFNRANTRRRNTINVGPSEAQIRKLKSKFAPSDL
jgi:hypothetical protein